MKKLISNIVFSLPIFLLIACASEEKYREKVNTWVGQPVDHLVGVWGEPDKIEKKDSGKKVYSYSDHHDREALAVTDPLPESSSSDSSDSDSKKGSLKGRRAQASASVSNPSFDEPCLTVFYVTPDGKVDSVGYGGTGCRAR